MHKLHEHPPHCCRIPYPAVLRRDSLYSEKINYPTETLTIISEIFHQLQGLQLFLHRDQPVTIPLVLIGDGRCLLAV